jgi:SAM-dependent methyltransferase
MQRKAATRIPHEVLEALTKGTCIWMVLSGRRALAEPGPRRVEIRPVALKGERRWQCTLFEGDQVTHQNLARREALRRVTGWLEHRFAQALVCTADADYQVTLRGGAFRVHKGPPTRAPRAQQHNRPKKRLIPEGTPCPFLEAMGVMTPEGRVRQAMQHKFRQVNRFLELVNDIVPDLPARDPLRIVDYGCGKSYLTFALHHLFAVHHQRDVELVGLDLKSDVVGRCQELAEQLNCRGLSFVPTSIADYEPAGPVDLAISLHACDTATDDALFQAVRWQSAVILAVPCCQHELAARLRSAELAPLLRQGLLRERVGALVTDALRVLVLEAAGYAAEAVEFIDLDHTPKNVLIRARRRARQDPALLAARREELARFLASFSLGDTHLTRCLAQETAETSQTALRTSPSPAAQPGAACPNLPGRPD